MLTISLPARLKVSKISIKRRALPGWQITGLIITVVCNKHQRQSVGHVPATLASVALFPAQYVMRDNHYDSLPISSVHHVVGHCQCPTTTMVPSVFSNVLAKVICAVFYVWFIALTPCFNLLSSLFHIDITYHHTFIIAVLHSSSIMLTDDNAPLSNVSFYDTGTCCFPCVIKLRSSLRILKF